MTDKENRIFEEWFEEKKEKCEVYGNGDDFWVDDEIKKFCLMGYELGLKAGRPQRHDLRENPNDLPKKVGDYVTNIGVLTYDNYGNGVYKWHTPFCEACDYSDVVGDDEVIAWCEIPTFDKE